MACPSGVACRTRQAISSSTSRISAVGVSPASASESQPGIEPPGRGMTSSAAPPIRKDAARVTMIAGRRNSATAAPTAAPISPPDGDHGQNAGQGPAQAVADQRRGQDAAEAHGRAYGEIDAAHQHDQGLGEGDHRDRKPVLGEAGDAREAQQARKQGKIDREQGEEQQIEAAKPAVATPEDARVQLETAQGASALTTRGGRGRHARRAMRRRSPPRKARRARAC